MESLLRTAVYLSLFMATDAKCTNVREAKEWLETYNKEADIATFNANIAAWNAESNITKENEKNSTLYDKKFSEFRRKKGLEAKSKFDWMSFPDGLRRQFNLISTLGVSALNDEKKLEKLSNLENYMQGIYSKAKIEIDGKALSLDPDLTHLLAKSRDKDLLLKIWTEWRNMTGKKMKDKYAEFVALSNEAVREDGWSDTGEYWRSLYEDDTFKENIKDLWRQLLPTYKLLHAYTRGKLIKHYGNESFTTGGTIPAHLLGNMWAQEWNNIYDLVLPFKGKQIIDVTTALKNQNYTALRMFKTAESFFTSLGLKPLKPLFWEKSIIEKPKDGRDLVCHPSAWDFYNGEDFRIKMCTTITMEDFSTIHHEMGHIQYFMQYKDQPYSFKDGANPGFHEAVGDTMSLSASSAEYLTKIGLLPSPPSDKKSDLNFLMLMALEKLALLPFAYIMDLWRWSVFAGETPKSRYNEKWWELRCKYQGISSPVQRSEQDFDPGAKFHIPANVPYIRYFVSFVIQFQFFKTLCQAANYTGPLHRCNIYESTEAGTKLSNLLKKGLSVPWKEALKSFNGGSKMDTAPLIEYFQPLIEWLNCTVKNEGWTCPPSTEPSH